MAWSVGWTWLRTELVGGPLVAQVDGRLDGQAAAEQQPARSSTVLPEVGVGQEVLDGVVAEERRRPRRRSRCGVAVTLRPSRLALGLLGLARGRSTLSWAIRCEHDVAPLHGPVGVVRRVVAGRVLHQAGEQRRLRAA